MKVAGAEEWFEVPRDRGMLPDVSDPLPDPPDPPPDLPVHIPWPSLWRRAAPSWRREV